MRAFIFFLLVTCALQAEPTNFKARLEKGAPGNYIVSQQDKNYSLLRIRERTEKRLVLEEITAPESLLDLSSLVWTKWLAQGAPGHSSWVLYEIDLATGKLLECYSVSQKGWLTLDQPILPKMLGLPLTPTPQDKRRRIGPAPQRDENDTRALWFPPLIFDGKKVQKPTMEVFETRWPDDNSQLAACRLELYFLPNFPFPFWLETSNGHYTLKVKSIECGRESHSPLTISIPHRPH